VYPDPRRQNLRAFGGLDLRQRAESVFHPCGHSTTEDGAYADVPLYGDRLGMANLVSAEDRGQLRGEGGRVVLEAGVVRCAPPMTRTAPPGSA